MKSKEYKHQSDSIILCLAKGMLYMCAYVCTNFKRVFTIKRTHIHEPTDNVYYVSI